MDDKEILELLAMPDDLLLSHIRRTLQRALEVEAEGHFTPTFPDKVCSKCIDVAISYLSTCEVMMGEVVFQGGDDSAPLAEFELDSVAAFVERCRAAL